MPRLIYESSFGVLLLPRHSLWLPFILLYEEKNLFVVFYAARSGSDWLLDLLDAHQDICIPAGTAPSRGDHCDGHALICERDMEQLVASGARVDKAFDAAAKYRVEHPKNQTDACNHNGWKQPMQWLAGATRHRGERFDRASFVKWIIAKRVIDLVGVSFVSVRVSGRDEASLAISTRHPRKVSPR